MSAPVLIGLAGSPRAGGNSDRLLDAFLEAAASSGLATERIAARDLRFAYCDGCGACAFTGACVHEDDASDLLARIARADAFVIASPVYFAGVPAVLKGVLDRMQPCWAKTYRLGQPRSPKRPGGFLLVGAGGDPFGTQGAEATLASVLQVCGFAVEVRERFIGLDAPDDLGHAPEMVERARAAGRALAARVLRGTAGTA
ncbi:flavodoxin family protein [Coriobacteriia bacterium Es71-Z0120]|uniref:flavodoxin family protein n=1 Tax=Parvivirga hydrogeniphila TaxID=2939460 RepID=UPI0022609914|nr:flavodoxin family protein [Parvivirga hydrogeniphila]MCL4079508.1 flavodoxin family protein [Parvivirga hydrogeniphila]